MGKPLELLLLTEIRELRRGISNQYDIVIR